MSTLYKCEKCGSYHASKELAEACENRKDNPSGLKIGDLVYRDGNVYRVVDFESRYHSERPVGIMLGGRKRRTMNHWYKFPTNVEKALLKMLQAKYPENVRKIV